MECHRNPHLGKTLVQAAKHADRHGVPPISYSTAKSYLNNLSALFKWAVREEYAHRNPFEQLAVPGTPTKKKDRKDPFAVDQLVAIFNAPLFTGCRDDGPGYAQPGPNTPRRGRFWVPLLSLWTGMRLNECCQLDVGDIKTIDGTDCIVIRETDDQGDDDDDKRVKSASGERFVPVHPELKRIGFMIYVGEMRERNSRKLFPELKVGQDGYYSSPFSKWFKRFCIKAGAKADKTSFHSFRHNYRDALREAEIGIERVRALGG